MGNHVWLGNRLLMANRQWMISVGALAQRFLNKQVTGHFLHCRQDQRVSQPALNELLLDHALAGLGVV